MRSLFNIFKKKEEKEEEVREKEIGKCFICNQPIREGESYKTITYNNQKYLVHVKCLRKAKKEAKDYLIHGIKP